MAVRSTGSICIVTAVDNGSLAICVYMTCKGLERSVLLSSSRRRHGVFAVDQLLERIVPRLAGRGGIAYIPLYAVCPA